MPFGSTLHSDGLILAEGSVYERLRHDPRIRFDASVAHGCVLYDSHGSRVLAAVHREYLDVGAAAGIPMLLQTDTWRCTGARVAASPYDGRDINADNVAFLRRIEQRWRRARGSSAPAVYIAGLIGPAGDAFQPSDALSATEAQKYHRPQINALAAAGVDVLLVATLPARTEAIGLARAMADCGQQYILSFVVRSDGAILDGTPLPRVIEEIDGSVAPPPVAYGINCTHASTARAALELVAERDRALIGRIAFFQANSSALPPEELDGQPDIVGDDAPTFADGIWTLQEEFPMRVVGGCCGTDAGHLRALAARLKGGVRGLRV